MTGIPVWTPGQVLAAADVNTWFVPIVKVKPSDESVTSSTTLQVDNDLVAAVAANAVYSFQIILSYSAATTGDLRVQLQGPASSSIISTCACIDVAGAGAIDSALTSRRGALPSTALDVGGVGAGVDTPFLWMGTLTTAGTAGNFSLYWAQATSSATATIVYTGSLMRLDRAG